MEKILTVTSLASKRLKNLLIEAGEKFVGIRIEIKTKGCSGLAYSIELVNEKKPYDEIIIEDGINIFIDCKAVIFLFGSEMDFICDKLQFGFVFRNPNEKGRCGCGESFHI